MLDELRASERRPRHLVALDDIPPLEASTRRSSAARTIDALWRAIDGLSVDLKMALLLRDVVRPLLHRDRRLARDHARDRQVADLQGPRGGRARARARGHHLRDAGRASASEAATEPPVLGSQPIRERPRRGPRARRRRGSVESSCSWSAGGISPCVDGGDRRPDERRAAAPAGRRRRPRAVRGGARSPPAAARRRRRSRPAPRRAAALHAVREALRQRIRQPRSLISACVRVDVVGDAPERRVPGLEVEQQPGGVRGRRRGAGRPSRGSAASGPPIRSISVPPARVPADRPAAVDDRERHVAVADERELAAGVARSRPARPPSVRTYSQTGSRGLAWNRRDALAPRARGEAVEERARLGRRARRASTRAAAAASGEKSPRSSSSERAEVVVAREADLRPLDRPRAALVRHAARSRPGRRDTTPRRAPPPRSPRPPPRARAG